MKYILFLAFEYKYYKKPAVIELFADDLLIDSIELHKSIGRKNGELVHPTNADTTDETKAHVLEKVKKSNCKDGYRYQYSREYRSKDEIYIKWVHWLNSWSVCEKIFTFEIDESVLKSKLTVNVLNKNNNNYTNGFMTESSWVKFDAVGLLPKKYFDNIDLVDKELPDVLGSGHGRPSPYDMDVVQDWTWPGLVTSAKYDHEKDDWVENGKDDFISNSLAIGDNFRYEFDLGEWSGMRVIRPKNVSDRFLNELYCIMSPVFLTYMLAAGLNK